MAQEYPLPRFHFEVHWNTVKINFAEVTGLVMEREKIEYRHGDSHYFNKISMPGLLKSNNITLKRGQFANNFDFETWFNEVTTDRVMLRYELLIILLNEVHQPVVKWTATRCFPVKITAPDLKSDANEIAIESIEVAHEGLRQVK